MTPPTVAATATTTAVTATVTMQRESDNNERVVCLRSFATTKQAQAFAFATSFAQLLSLVNSALLTV